jgi:hypothetical protein
MWGKITERSNRPQTKLISQPQELYKFLSTPGIEVRNLFIANDQVVWIFWRFAENEGLPSLRQPTTSLVHTSQLVGEYIFTVTWTDSKRKLFIVIQIL